MLLHLLPKFLICDISGPDVALIDLRIPELDLTLRAGTDLVARQPYPNKRYWVAMRKGSRKAIQGLLIETPGRLDTFTVETRWAIQADAVALHRVTHKVLDTEFDAVSADMLLWHGMCDGLGGWTRRVPDCYADLAPVAVQPHMTLSPRAERTHTGAQYRTLRPAFIERSETFCVPTIEPGRLAPHAARDRLPALDSAFQVGTSATRGTPLHRPSQGPQSMTTPTFLPTPIPLPRGVVAKIELTPMPQPGRDGRYPPSTDTAVHLSFFRDDVLLERRYWHTVICDAPAVTLADGTTLDADDLEALDAAGWDQLLHYGVMPGALV